MCAATRSPCSSGKGFRRLPHFGRIGGMPDQNRPGTDSILAIARKVSNFPSQFINGLIDGVRI